MVDHIIQSAMSLGISPWILSRGMALTAYALLSASVVAGILSPDVRLSGRLRARLSQVHESSLRWALGLAAIHALVLMYDTYMPFRIVDLLWPPGGPYRPLATTLGAGAMWGVFVVLVAFDLRGRLSGKVWRSLHRLGFPIYSAATLHGVLAGSDTGDTLVTWMYVASIAAVGLAVTIRHLLPSVGRTRAAAKSSRRSPRASLSR